MLTKDEIVEMARQAWISEKEAQLITEFDMAYISCTYLTDLVAFAKLVEERTAIRERETCANLCWKNEDDNAFVNAYNGKRLDLLCAELIRARGTT